MPDIAHGESNALPVNPVITWETSPIPALKTVMVLFNIQRPLHGFRPHMMEPVSLAPDQARVLAAELLREADRLDPCGGCFMST